MSSPTRTTQPTRMDRVVDWFLTLGALGVLGTSLYFTTDSLPSFEVCTFKRITGMPCPGCGLTRAFCSISHGQLSQAWNFNPFSFLFYSVAVYLVLRPLIKRRYPDLESNFSKSHWSTTLPILLIVSLLVFGVLRMIFSPESA